MGRNTPSPATVISIIALVFAVAGTAVASVATVSVLNKKEKKQTRRIADAEIGKAAPGLSVKHAASAETATRADNAANAESLGGLGPSAFLRSGIVKAGFGDNTSVPAATLISWPELGLVIETDGDADNDDTVCFRSTRGSGNLERSASDGAETDIAPGATSCLTAPATGLTVYLIDTSADPSRSLLVACEDSGPQSVRCQGFASRAD